MSKAPLTHPYDQQEVYEQDVVFFAKNLVYHYQDVSEPNELPEAYDMYVPKRKYDKAVKALKDIASGEHKLENGTTLKTGSMQMKQIATIVLTVLGEN